MSSAVTAVVGGALIGGYFSNQAADSAADSANNATGAASAASAAELAFAKENKARWDEVFGPTQDNLAKYYNNLDPTSVAAKNVVGIQQAYQESQKQIDVQLAQRGMSDSGLSADLMSKNLYSNEQSKAQARADAPQQVAAQQSSFLGLGMGLESSINSSITSAYQGQQATANNRYLAATQAQSAANTSMGQIIGSGTQALTSYLMKPTYYDAQPGFIGPSRG